jgi:hypothetical protein
MRRTALFFFLIAIPFSSNAQSVWRPLFGSFLEPNRFTTVYDADPHRLRLEAGYGTEFLRFSNVDIGAEGFIWSGLKTRSDFRFPVETADYFFGFNAVIQQFPYPALMSRIRLSHISSHLVDGTQDSVVGGSSSHYSREFVSFESQYVPFAGESSFRVSAGIKFLFHQVTKVEPVVQFPVTVEYTPLRWASENKDAAVRGGEIFLSAGTAGGPQYPLFTGSFVLRLQPSAQTATDFYVQYYNGDTKYGVEGDAKRSGFEFGLRLATISF